MTKCSIPECTTLDFERVGAVKLNLNWSKLAITSLSLDAWRAFAKTLHPLLHAPHQTNQFTFRNHDRAIYQSFEKALLQALSLQDVRDALNLLLAHSADARSGSSLGKTSAVRKVAGTRMRTAIGTILGMARADGLILLPTGQLRSQTVPWLPPRILDIPAKRDLLKRLQAISTTSVNASDCVLLITQFKAFNGFCQFDETIDLTSEFFAVFWKWIHSDFVKMAKFSGMATAYSRRIGLFEKSFSILFKCAVENDANFETPLFSYKYIQRGHRNKNSTTATDFGWLRRDVDFPKLLTPWLDELTWWINHYPIKQPKSLVATSKHFLRFLVALPNPPCSPFEFSRRFVIRRPDSPPQTLLEFVEAEGLEGRPIGYAMLTDMLRFFEDWHDHRANHLQGWRCPILRRDVSRPPVSLGKTNKDILPLRILRMMKELLYENDFAWPKSVSSDYFEYFDAETKQFRPMWSPVRAIALLALLTIPIRTIQVRLLDSGEADEQILDYRSGTWNSNPHTLAQKGRRLGFWRRMHDFTTQADFVGMYISTNKTAVVSSAEFEKGYEIPWQCDALFQYIDFLTTWQGTYNPVTRLISRIDSLQDALRPSAAVRRLPGFTFLFRDPANSTLPRDEPLSYPRLSRFYLLALQEVERRLEAAGEKVSLISKSSTGYLSSTYSLHGLRAAGITHFVQAGVPIQVIAEFVSGHATILMTLYYSKFGPAYVTDVLDKAQESIAQNEGADFTRYLADSSDERLRALVVGNSEAGYRLLSDTTPGLWSISLDGICPTGRSLCDQGGEQLSTHNNPYYAPVPGGPRNCGMCRFFITGPTFLNGQVIAFNNLVFAISEKAKDLQRCRVQLAEARAAHASVRQIRRTEVNVEALEVEIDIMLRALQARYQLIERSRELQTRTEQGDNGHYLLTKLSQGEAAELIVEQTSEFDLVEFVAQSCQLFPEKSEPSARLRKGRFLDQFLARNGYQALFYQLPEEEALAAGNRLTRFLQSKVGRDRLRSLMDGNATLASMGMVAEFEKGAGPLLGRVTLRVDSKRPDA